MNTMYIWKNLDFFNFNLTHWKQKSYFPKITSFRWPPFRSRHWVSLLRMSPITLWSICIGMHLTSCWIRCLSFEDLRFQITPEKEITCWKIGWAGWPCDVPVSGDNMVRKQIPHSCHGISCGVARSSILLEKRFFGYRMTSKLRT